MTTGASRQIVVAGAGVAGLTAALAFARQGFLVKVFEQAASLQEAGAGIQLSPNATRLLGRLGVLDRLGGAALHPDAIVLRAGATLAELARIPLGQAEARWQAPYLVVHRADLQSALLATVSREPDIQVTLSARLRDAALHARGATALFDIERKTIEVEASLLVGADGVWSTARNLSGGSTESRFTGNIAWRTTLRKGAVGVDAQRWLAARSVTAILMPKLHLVAYPIRNGDAFNLVAVTQGPPIAAGYQGQADSDILRRAVEGAEPQLVDLVRGAEPWTAWPIHAVDFRKSWISGSGLALIGDAAHALPPYAAQGAAMAIEDAVTLAAAVAGAQGERAATLQDWQDRRRTRVAKVTRRGAFNKFAWHASGPIAMARNLVLRMRPPERLAADLDWLYGWDPSLPGA